MKVVQTMLDYAIPGPLTVLDGVPPAALEPLPEDPLGICRTVHALVIQPADAEAVGLPEQRRAANKVRPAHELLQRLLAVNPAPVTVPRPATDRVVGTCRHFAVLACALLRHRGIASRVRCGFATYFRPGLGVDHWVTEYRDGRTGRWVRVDPESLGEAVLRRPEDLGPGDFLSGGEAWEAYRRGAVDAARFGVSGSANWGPGEIRGNAVKDLAALNKVEMLPWDEWGRMTDAFDGRTGPDYDELLDELAAVCASDEPPALATLFTRREFEVPAELVG